MAQKKHADLEPQPQDLPNQESQEESKQGFQQYIQLQAKSEVHHK